MINFHRKAPFLDDLIKYTVIFESVVNGKL